MKWLMILAPELDNIPPVVAAEHGYLREEDDLEDV